MILIRQERWHRSVRDFDQTPAIPQHVFFFAAHQGYGATVNA